MPVDFCEPPQATNKSAPNEMMAVFMGAMLLQTVGGSKEKTRRQTSRRSELFDAACALDVLESVILDLVEQRAVTHL